MPDHVHTAPSDAGPCVRGKTLPELLYDAAEAYENPRALNQPGAEGWIPMSLDQFRERAEETALGLHELGLDRGDKVALLMGSDVHYCVVDMGCLIGGLIDVPLYLSSAPEQMQYVADHAEADALVVSNPKRLAQAVAIGLGLGIAAAIGIAVGLGSQDYVAAHIEEWVNRNSGD